MPRKRKINLPLLEVIIFSLAIHLAAIVLLGGYTIYTALTPDDVEMEAPPPPQKIETQKLQMQVRLQQQQKRSSQPMQKITVTNVSNVNLPDLDVNMPTVNTKVAVGGNYGAGRLSDDFGGGSIDFSKSAVDFFGIKSKGERVTFIVDASKYMLEDKKGGIPAYNIIKQEISRMVDKLSSGTLFNVIFYNGNTLQAYSPKLLPATRQNKELFKQWITPINQDYSSVGRLKGNLDVERRDIEPMTDKARNWIKAVQAAMEQGSDSINLIVADWQFNGRLLSGEELEKWHREHGWGPEQEKIWDESVKKARAWLEEENRKRRAAGKPERVVVWIGSIVRELFPNVKGKSSPSFSIDEVDQFLSNVQREIYRDADKRPPPINVVQFLGANEDESKNNSVKHFENLAEHNRGKFRILKGMEALTNLTGRSEGEG